MKKIICLITILSSQFCSALTVFHNKPSSDNDKFNIALLGFVIHKVDPSVELRPSEEIYTDGRVRAELERGRISVVWAVTSNEMEQKFLPVRYCVFKGLLGYRVFLINKGDQYKFDNVKNLADLTQLRAGQGEAWTDTSVLKSAGIPVVTSTKYVNLFPMLHSGRFDYFPRGIFEPWAEIPVWQQFDFTVEKKILVQYPSAFYFFVNKNDKQLADLITKGFELAISDGSYDDFFYSSPTIANAIVLSDLEHRTVIKLNNPDLPKSTPLWRNELWFDFSKARAVAEKTARKKLNE